MSEIASRHRGILADMEKEARAKADAAKVAVADADAYRANVAAFEAELPVIDADWPQSLEIDIDRITRAVAAFKNPAVGPDVKRCFEQCGFWESFANSHPCDLAKPHIIRVFLEEGPVPWVEIKRVGVCYSDNESGQPLARWNGMILGPSGVMIGKYAYHMRDGVMHKCWALFYNMPADAPVGTPESAPAPADTDIVDKHKDKRVKRKNRK